MRKSKALSLWLILFVALLGNAQESRPPASSESLKFAVIGDTGTGSTTQYQVAETLTAARAKFPFEFVVMMGDNLYGAEGPKDFEKKFERPYQALLKAGVKFYASLGNHDEPPRQIDYKLFSMGGKRYYTFKPKDGIRFFALDSNYMDKEQIDWLDKELSASGSEWKVVFFHHPLYSSGERHGSNIQLRAVLEPLLVKYGVDVVLTGHEHFYERIKAQKGINYFIVGSSAKLRAGNIGKSDLTAKGFDRDNVFMLGGIAGDEMSFQVISRGGNTVDSGTVRRAEKRTTAASSPK